MFRSWYFLILFITSIVNFWGCSEPDIIHPDNFKLTGKPPAWGLETIDGERVLEEEYLFLKIKQLDFLEDKYCVNYTSSDQKRRGFYLNHLDEPYFEIDSTFKYFKFINSIEHFCFGGQATDKYLNTLEGVMDKSKNIILSPEFSSILHYGNQYFYAANPSDKLYSIFDLKGDLVKNTGRYGWVYNDKGITWASKARDGSGDIWGAKSCLLDENGKEITEHIYQNIAVFECIFDETKVYLSMRENGIHTLYYPNGELIYKNIGISPIAYKSGYSEKFKKNAQKQLGNKNLIGIFKEKGKTFYLTYEGEVIEAKKEVTRF